MYSGTMTFGCGVTAAAFSTVRLNERSLSLPPCVARDAGIACGNLQI